MSTFTTNALRRLCAAAALACALSVGAGVRAQAPRVLNDPVDVSRDFEGLEQAYFVDARVKEFDAASGRGTLQWYRYVRSAALSFNKVDVGLVRGRGSEFPRRSTTRTPRSLSR